jgi:hypothetical protein
MVAASYFLQVQMFGLMKTCVQSPIHSMGGDAASHVLVVDSSSLLRQLLRLMTLQQDLTVVSVVLAARYKR